MNFKHLLLHYLGNFRKWGLFALLWMTFPGDYVGTCTPESSNFRHSLWRVQLSWVNFTASWKAKGLYFCDLCGTNELFTSILPLKLPQSVTNSSPTVVQFQGMAQWIWMLTYSANSWHCHQESAVLHLLNQGCSLSLAFLSGISWHWTSCSPKLLWLLWCPVFEENKRCLILIVHTIMLIELKGRVSDFINVSQKVRSWCDMIELVRKIMIPTFYLVKKFI